MKGSQYIPILFIIALFATTACALGPATADIKGLDAGVAGAHTANTGGRSAGRSGGEAGQDSLAGASAEAGRSGIAGSSSNTVGGAGGAPGTLCDPGKTIDCRCSNGDDGTQVCTEDGTGYDACDCDSGTACDPGETDDCTCDDGSSGERECNASGTWATCICDGPLPECVPGEQPACTCPDGRTSYRRCNDEGFWGACVCDDTIPECVPGEQPACTCPDGRTSYQVCRKDGTWGACVCEPSGTGGTSGAGGASSTGGSSSDTGGASNTGGTSSDTGGAANTGGSSSNIGGASSTGGSSAQEYVAVMYTCWTENSTPRDVIKINHEALDASGNALPRTDPYGPLWDTGTQSTASTFEMGQAMDGPNGQPKCEAHNSGMVTCTVHVPAGSTVRYNAEYYDAASNGAPGASWYVCNSVSGDLNGYCEVRDPRTGWLLDHVIEPYPTETGDNVCILVYTAPE